MPTTLRCAIGLSFWQGPSEDDPAAWPYEGDWLSDIREEGPENYAERFEP